VVSCCGLYSIPEEALPRAALRCMVGDEFPKSGDDAIEGGVDLGYRGGVMNWSGLTDAERGVSGFSPRSLR
jgi:hypothetical protein